MNGQPREAAHTTPPVQTLGDAVLLQGPAVLDVFYLAAMGARELAHRDGGAAPALRQELLRALSSTAAVVRSRGGHRDVAPTAHPSESKVLDEMTTGEAAMALRLSRRQVQRLASQLNARRVAGGALVYDRGAVQALAHQRATTTTEPT